MHAYLAFLAGVLVVFAGLLIFWASIGVAFAGLAREAEVITAVILLIIAAITIWLFYIGIKAQYKKVKTGKEALIGAKGIAVSDINPKGEIRVLGEFWQATAKEGAIANGEAVLVVDMDGMFLVVVPDQQNT
jgi:membrane-bound ClpP family serine protease